MDLRLSDEQLQIAGAIGELLAHASDSARVREVAFSGDGFDRELWRQVGELGACGVHLPEARGGLGLGVTELALVAEAMGRRLACVPWLESVALAGSTLLGVEESPAAARWLDALASGTEVFTLDIGLLGAGPVTARRTAGGGWSLDGCLPAVPAAMAAQRLLLAAQCDAQSLLCVVPLDAPGIHREARPTHDGTRPLGAVTLTNVGLDERDCLARGAAAERALEAGRRVAAVALASEQVGVAQQCLELTVAYLGQRVQFGQPLATFQALKHRCAQMMVAVELARSAVLGAAREFDARVGPRRLQRVAAMARCLADDAAQFCTQEAIQLHGGVGFTWDYDPQLYFKRAQAARAWLGTPAEWRELVADALFEGAAA